MKLHILLLFCVFLFASCIKPDNLIEEGTAMNPYFDIKGFIEKQVATLKQEKAQVKKHTSVNGKEERLPATDSINWEKELGLFADADINRNILAKSYKIDTTQNEGGNTVIYTALEEGLRVRRIEVVEAVGGMATSLEIDFQEENPVYATVQHLNMTVFNGRVQEYRLRGFQKMTMQDTLMYYVVSEVIWPNKVSESEANFDWLLGDWKRVNEKEGKETFEQWKKKSETLYVGIGFTMQKSDTVSQEAISLIKLGDGEGWSLMVNTPQQPVVSFQVTAFDNSSFTCENTANDFPKKIKYWKNGDRINALVSGDDLEIPFEFEKVQ